MSKPIDWSAEGVLPPVYYDKKAAQGPPENYRLAQAAYERVPLGEGAYGQVFVSRANSKLAVKKSHSPMQLEYLIGCKLNHPNLVKSHALFIKHQYNPQGERKWFDQHRLVMGRIQEHSQCLSWFPTGQKVVPPTKVTPLLCQAVDVCLYLFEQKICWHDVNECNAYISDDARHLLIADFGHWRNEEDSRLRGYLLWGELCELVLIILQASGLKDALQLADCTGVLSNIRADRWCNSGRKELEQSSFQYFLPGTTDEQIKKTIAAYIRSIEEGLPRPAIPKQPEESGIWQGGSSKFSPGTSDHCL